MATAEHCLFCFEALNAALNDTKVPTLDEVKASWNIYNSSVASGRVISPKIPALQRVAATASDSDSTSAASSSASSLGPSTPATSTSSLTPQALDAAPLFVTWNTLDSSSSDDDDNGNSDDDGGGDNRRKKSKKQVSLRGCIGTFESQPLADGLSEYAVISALQDTRFPPISRRELPTLQVAVTLLTDFEEAANAHDWEVGKHGIRLAFSDRGRRYGATYLPDVAAEQGWTKDETLLSLARKAGWTGSRSRLQDLGLQVTRYQGKKKALNYDEYKKWKDWVATRQT